MSQFPEAEAATLPFRDVEAATRRWIRQTSTRTKVLVGVWVLVVFAAFGVLWYNLTDARHGEPSSGWPADTFQDGSR